MNVVPQSLSRGKCVCMLLFGLPGVGKTRFIGTGDSTLIIRPPTDHTDSIELPANVEELVVRDWTDTFEVFQWGQQGGFKKYEWTWLDSISLFEDMGLDDVFADAVARKESRRAFGPDKGEYGINRSRLGKWIRDMVGLAEFGVTNFGVVANVMQWWDPVKQEDIWMPLVGSAQSSMAVKMCGYMNIVAYLQKAQVGQVQQRQLLVDAKGFAGKDQYNCFPELKSGRHGFTNPSMSDITEAIGAARKAGGSRPKRRPRRSASK